MLALANDAARARLVIAATAVRPPPAPPMAQGRLSAFGGKRVLHPPWVPPLLRQQANGVISFRLRTSRTGGAYDSHHRTSGIAGRIRRCCGGMAARGPARVVRPINGGKSMIGRHIGIALAALGSTAIAAPALAQNEQFIPALVYRTGAYAPNGAPIANGISAYYTLINERDGGINGVKIVWEECEFGYATDRGVECYERLKRKGPTGAAYVNPFSTGVTFALTEKAPLDKIPLITMGYGRSESRDGSVFQWNFPLLGTYWTAADIILQ